MVSSPRVSQTTVIRAEFCTVAIQNEVLAKLSKAVLPSSAATTATAPGGADQLLRLASGLISRSSPSTLCQGETFATVVA